MRSDIVDSGPRVLSVDEIKVYPKPEPPSWLPASIFSSGSVKKREVGCGFVIGVGFHPAITPNDSTIDYRSGKR